jgi:hypothetical protein
MSDAFGIEAITSVITVDADNPAAAVEMDVINVLDRHVQAGVEVRGEGALEPTWVAVEPDRFPLDAKQSRRVSAYVALPSDAPPGEYRFTLRVYDVDRPADAFATSPPLTLRREEDSNQRPQWVFPALAVLLVIVVGLIVWLVFRDNGDGTTTAEPPIRSEGVIDVGQTFTLDLDTGTVGGGDDVQFEAQTSTLRFLRPLDGRIALFPGDEIPGFEDCRDAPVSGERIPIQDIEEGSHVCARTNEGRVARITVQTPPGPSPGTLTIDHTTWEPTQ